MKFNNLDTAFSEMYKTNGININISTTATAGRSFCSLKRIKTYLRATEGTKPIGQFGYYIYWEKTFFGYEKVVWRNISDSEIFTKGVKNLFK